MFDVNSKTKLTQICIVSEETVIIIFMLLLIYIMLLAAALNNLQIPTNWNSIDSTVSALRGKNPEI